MQRLSPLRLAVTVSLTLVLCVEVSSAQQNPTPQQNIPTQATPVLEKAVEVNTALMESTFKVEGPNSMGTVFILGRPLPDGKKLRYVLVTAAHVLSDIQGDTATVYFRRRITNSSWQTVPKRIQIRAGNSPLWKQHPTADVAVMYVDVPNDALPDGVVPTTMIADDDTITKFKIHPGDEVSCLGYPLGDESKPFGFPILRTGRIASYPLLPSETTKTFLLDFAIFPGNSGGPAYFIFTGMREGTLHLGLQLAIMGVVSKEHNLANRISLGIAEIVHGSLVVETIGLLPPPE